MLKRNSNWVGDLNKVLQAVVIIIWSDLSAFDINIVKMHCLIIKIFSEITNYLFQKYKKYELYAKYLWYIWVFLQLAFHGDNGYVVRIKELMYSKI